MLDTAGLPDCCFVPQPPISMMITSNKVDRHFQGFTTLDPSLSMQDAEGVDFLQQCVTLLGQLVQFVWI